MKLAKGEHRRRGPPAALLGLLLCSIGAADQAFSQHQCFELVSRLSMSHSLPDLQASQRLRSSTGEELAAIVDLQRRLGENRVRLHASENAGMQVDPRPSGFRTRMAQGWRRFLGDMTYQKKVRQSVEDREKAISQMQDSIAGFRSVEEEFRTRDALLKQRLDLIDEMTEVLGRNRQSFSARGEEVDLQAELVNLRNARATVEAGLASLLQIKRLLDQERQNTQSLQRVLQARNALQNEINHCAIGKLCVGDRVRVIWQQEESRGSRPTRRVHHPALLIGGEGEIFAVSPDGFLQVRDSEGGYHVSVSSVDPSLVFRDVSKGHHPLFDGSSVVVTTKDSLSDYLWGLFENGDVILHNTFSQVHGYHRIRPEFLREIKASSHNIAGYLRTRGVDFSGLVPLARQHLQPLFQRAGHSVDVSEVPIQPGNFVTFDKAGRPDSVEVQASFPAALDLSRPSSLKLIFMTNMTRWEEREMRYSFVIKIPQE